MRKNIVRGYFGGLIIFGVLAVNWFIHSESAFAVTTVGECKKDAAGFYTCTPPAVPLQHILVNGGTWLCHGDVIVVTPTQVNAQITENTSNCPWSPLPASAELLFPPHATPPVATCTKIAGPTNDYTCTATLALGNHVELNQNPGICHVAITSVVSAGVGGVAYYRVEEKINGCLPDVGSTGLFPYTIPAPPVTLIDVPADYSARNWVYQVVAEGLSKGCGPKDANGTPIGPIDSYCPTVPTTRGEMSVWILRMVHGQAYVPPVVP